MKRRYLIANTDDNYNYEWLKDLYKGSVEALIAHQDDDKMLIPFLKFMFPSIRYTDDEAKKLLNNVKNKEFWYYMSDNKDVFNNLSIEMLIEHQDDVCWDEILEHRDFSIDEFEQLINKVKNNEVWKFLSRNKTLFNNLSLEWLIKHQDKVNWKEIIDIKKFTNDEKKELLLSIPKLGAYLSTNILQEENIDLKTFPNKQWYNIGEQDLHDQRSGTFVVVQNGINGKIDIAFDDKGDKSEHSEMLTEMAKTYGYDNETMYTLLNIENYGKIGYQLDMLTDDEEKQKQQQKKFSETELHCCCGYIFIIDNQAIAIMDAGRTVNFFPLQLAKALKGKTFDGCPIVAVGINGSENATAFMKLARKTKRKRLQKSNKQKSNNMNFKILYWL